MIIQDFEVLEIAIRFTSYFIWHLYLLLPSFFLYTLAWSLSELFAQIGKEMERAFADGRDIGRSVRMAGVRHSLVCQAVWRLDVFFRNMMLINVSCIFVSSINFCFLILKRFSERNFSRAAVFIFAVLIRFAVLVAIGRAAERLKNKVGNFIVTEIALFNYHLKLCKLSTVKVDRIHQCLIKSNLLHLGNEADQVPYP